MEIIFLVLFLFVLAGTGIYFYKFYPKFNLKKQINKIEEDISFLEIGHCGEIYEDKAQKNEWIFAIKRKKALVEELKARLDLLNMKNDEYRKNKIN